MSAPIRVLIVDDSALARQVLADGLQADPKIDVVGSAADAFEALRLLIDLKPDVLTLDVEMPRMSGVEFLRSVMPRHPVPVVMASAHTRADSGVTRDALTAGAVGFVTKPSRNVAANLDSVLVELRAQVLAASRMDVSHLRDPSIAGRAATASAGPQVIAIGASTGGTKAIKHVLSGLPRDVPGIVVTQHMPAEFIPLYADRLDEQCAQDCRQAQDGDPVLPGQVLIAPGNLHTRVVRSGASYIVRCRPGPMVSENRPAVDVLFESMAASVAADGIGIVLTGAGADGARGLAAMRSSGARTLAQDAATCVVSSMPDTARRQGGVELTAALEDIAGQILGLLSLRRRQLRFGLH